MIFLKNLLRNKIRTTITVLGVAFGISAFVSLSSVSAGFKAQMGDMIKNYSIDITVTSIGAATPGASSISLADYDELRTMNDVRSVSSLIVGPVKAPWNPYFLLFGVSSLEGFLSRLGLVEGRPFDPGKQEIIIGERTAARHRVKLNDTILISQHESFKVVGIYTSGSRIVDGAGVVDIDDAKRLLRRGDSVNLAFVQVALGANLQGVINQINSRFKDLTAVRSGEFIGQLRLIHTIDVFAGVVTIISVLTCCFIILNTFLMAVSERIKEIGILRAVGWTRLMIVRMIVSESVVLCILGGLLGNLFALGELWGFQLTNPEGLGWLVSTSTSYRTVLTSMGLSLAVGVVGSLYPALRAAWLLPADALRHEQC